MTNADQMFDDFLFNNNRKDRKGIMTNARFGQFNKKFITNLTYYNEKDRYEYPKQMVNILYLVLMKWLIYGVITIT